MFRAIIPFQLGVRSHRVFSFTMFRVVFLSMTFLVTYSVRHAELLFQIGIHRCFFWLSIQSRCFVLAFRAISDSQLGVQSRVLFLFGVQNHIFISAFRVIAYFRFGVRSRVSIPTWRSKPLSTFVSAFRAMFCFVWHLELYLRSTFGSTSSFGVQSHHRIFVWRSKPSSHLRLAFRAVTS